MITLIVAMDQNQAIGKDGDIPWNIPEDLKMFQQETQGGALIMGRRTWESLPFKPLKGRFNCVVSSQEIEKCDAQCDSVGSALAACSDYSRIYGIGGAQIYHQLLPVAHRLLITRVHTVVDSPDTYFPTFEKHSWVKMSQKPLNTTPDCLVEEYIRKI
jgi:dihydrofolate reductase